MLQCPCKNKNKIKHSNTTLFNEWQSTMLHVLILKESSSGKVKVKYTLVQALRLCTGCMAHRGSRSIALLFLDHGARRG